jgi:hypothetical protein
MSYSILYRENVLFKLIENIMVGATIGHAIVMGIYQIRDLAIIRIIKGMQTGDPINILYIIPVILGIVLYLRFSKKYRDISRIPLALMLGVGLALSIRGLIFTNIIGQVKGAITPLTSIQSIIFLFGLVCVLLYFTYEKRVSTIAGPLPKIGRYFLMLTMGAYVAYTLLSRISTLSGTLNTLFVTPAWYLIPVAFLLILVDLILKRREPQ